MRDSKFWRVTAILFCAGVFYVGHGLHTGESVPFPSLLNTAHAGGLAVGQFPMGVANIYTTNQSGGVIYVWNVRSQGGVPEYAYTVRVGPEKGAPERSPAPERK